MSYFVERKITVKDFDLVKTMESEQAFCYECVDDGPDPIYFVLSGSHTCYVSARTFGSEVEVSILCALEPEELEYWLFYFGLTDRDNVENAMAVEVNELLKDKWPFHREFNNFRGVRVIKEDPWQALVASYLPDTWAAETRRSTLMRLVASAMRNCGLENRREMWHFPTAEELLAIPMCAPPLKNVGPRLQKMCREAIAQSYNPYDFTREAGSTVAEASVATKFLTDLRFNTIVRTIINGFHFSSVYTEECVNTAWIGQNMEEIRVFEKEFNSTRGSGTPYSCVSLLYIRIRYQAASKRREREKAKYQALKRKAQPAAT